MIRMNNSTCYLILTVLVLMNIMLTGCKKQINKTYTVGVINVVPDLDQHLAGFKEGMTEQGYIEGKNISYIYERATTDISKLPTAARALLDAGADLVLSITTPATLAVKEATAGTEVPVVFMAVTDPIGAGIVESTQHPGGNITGVTFGIQEARRLEWLLRIAPEAKQLYVPFNSKDRAPVLALKILSKTADKMGVKLMTYEIYDQKTLDYAVLNIPDKADAVFLMADSLLSTRLTDLVATANKRNLPTSGANITALKNHPILTAFGFDQHLSGQQTARLADQIFKGTRPADLPVETAEFYLAINLKTAKVIGLTIPEEILHQADIIIRE